MGRGRGRGRGGGGRGRGRGGDKGPGNGSFVTAEDKQNADFNEYYQAQGIVPEGEWGDFLACLQRPLPVTFRINGSGRFADILREKLQSDFFSHFQQGPMFLDGEPVEAPYPLPWYPNNYAWHINFSRGQLRKLPLLSNIHEFLKKANDAGSISRQEAVSMVPPLFLDVHPEHRVLDMCAAPGSKTFQLLEALHTPRAPSDTPLTDTDQPTAGTATENGTSTANGQAETANGTTAPKPLVELSPPGFVVANDVDFVRCNLLTHQLKRVCSPHLLVTNHSAEYFPLLTDAEGKPQRFDRVLCDVPCSGDGTMRKAPDIWRKWNVSGGNGLHIMQLRIALHGIELLEVGGTMVYSTCAFNPIEDEAVVAEILTRCQGGVELCDVSHKLPTLKRLPGKKQWLVRDKHMWYNSWEEAKDVGYKLEPSMFCTPEKQKLPLERCMRFLPHHQDTGGFFVAVLKKVRELPDDFRLPFSVRSQTGLQDGAAVEDVDGVPAEPPKPETLFAATRAAAEAAYQAASEAVDALGAGNTGALQEARRRVFRMAAQARRLANETRALQKKHERDAFNSTTVPTDAADAQLAKRARVDDPSAGLAGTTQANDGQVSEGSESDGMGGDVGDIAMEGDRIFLPHGTVSELDPLDYEEEADGPPEEIVRPAPTRTFSWVRGGGSRGRAEGGKHRHIDPVVPVEDPEILQLVCRTMDTDRPKRIYIISDKILKYLMLDTQEDLKIVATGLKIFERQEVKDGERVGSSDKAPGDDALASKCQYRVTQEALPYLLPYATRQRLYLTVHDMLWLLRHRHLPLHDKAASKDHAAYTVNPQLLGQLESLRPGCVICVLEPSDADKLGLSTGTEEVSDALMANAPMALSAWRGKSSIAIMVDKSETEQMAEKIESAQKRAEASSAAGAPDVGTEATKVTPALREEDLRAVMSES